MAVFVASHNMVSSLGFSSDDHFQHLFSGHSGIRITDDRHLTPEPIPASLIDREAFEREVAHEFAFGSEYTFFEKLMLFSAGTALKNCGIDAASSDTLFILSTTKGNVQLLETGEKPDNLYLWHSAQMLRNHFGNPNKAVVVSNACVSGVAAIVAAKRLIEAGNYKHAVVVGADIASRFVVAGFQSFHSLSPQACRPFDKNRDGLTLGEGAATVVLTSECAHCPSPLIEVVNGAVSNDANHISGPSRTGEGLLIAINETLRDNREVDFISAHGTATPYNDDMESKAISRAGLSHVPVNSLKGYIGHTLGAAGVIETVAHIGCMLHGRTIKTLGYSEFGVAEEITIAAESVEMPIRRLLKLASGFGGSNAALLLKKYE